MKPFHGMTPCYWKNDVRKAMQPFVTDKECKEVLGDTSEEKVTALLVDEDAEAEEAANIRNDIDSGSDLDPGDLVDGDAGDVDPESMDQHLFLKGHPQRNTHWMQVLDDDGSMVPNFIGGHLPRCDKGDREYYCATMLTLFKPWRAGNEWDDAFHVHTFSDEANKKMKYFNVKYECLDARDDFHAQRKSLELGMMQGMFTGYPRNYDGDVIGDNNMPEADLNDFMDKFDRTTHKGEMHRSHITNTLGDIKRVLLTVTRYAAFAPTRHVLWFQGRSLVYSIALAETHLHLSRSPTRISNPLHTLVPLTSGWLDACPDGPAEFEDFTFRPDAWHTPAHWQAAVQAKRQEIIAERVSGINSSKVKKKVHTSAMGLEANVDNTEGDVFMADKVWLDEHFKSADPENDKLIGRVEYDASLNTEQKRAFRIVANHASQKGGERLQMYLGEMGGTGKSRVIQALTEFFCARGEKHRFIVLAPTGSAAALLSGSTYHSVLGIYDDQEERPVTLKERVKVRAALEGVEYIFIDEV
ncbi:hypothetical protein HWV62_27468 [Athelia sp. TMB]|nr:hypothetical protein HWV62_27468 [Athelia sp. TMB]